MIECAAVKTPFGDGSHLDRNICQFLFFLTGCMLERKPDGIVCRLACSCWFLL